MSNTLKIKPLSLLKTVFSCAIIVSNKRNIIKKERNIMKSDKLFEDKVFGCWLGKCIGGNIGAPFEGMKQCMHLKYSHAFLENMRPNDDLDLQILWLDVLEEKGLGATIADYADAFIRNCEYAAGEYAFFRKNYRKGIMPPLSGTFNNEFFNEGMGAPIRSELWACLFADEPQRAAEYAARDASADHREGGESAHGEAFLAALESLCFGGGGIRENITAALGYIPENCKLHVAIERVAELCRECNDIYEILEYIIRDCGHSESCMVHQNISIAVAAMLLHPDSFTDAVMAAVNCGFDTDCTGATVGAVMGILLGGKEICRVCGVTDAEYKLRVRSPRKDLSVSALSRSVCKLRERLKSETPTIPELTLTQEGYPAIGLGESVQVLLRVHTALLPKKSKILLKLHAPLTSDKSEFTALIADGGLIEFNVSVDANEEKLPEAMPCEIYIDGEYAGRFGLSGKRRWKVSGPYWKNEVLVPELKAGDQYGSYIKGEGDEFFDNLRRFHLSCLPDTEACLRDIKNADRKFATADTAEDIIRLNDHTHFRGNSAYIFTTEFYSECDSAAYIQIGRNTPVCVWLNGEKIAERDGNETFYHECIHKSGLKLHRGVNRLEFMVVKNSDDTRFSYEFVKSGPFTEHVMFDTVNFAANLPK